jgi:hypothetical protein
VGDRPGAGETVLALDRVSEALRPKRPRVDAVLAVGARAARSSPSWGRAAAARPRRCAWWRPGAARRGRDHPARPAGGLPGPARLRGPQPPQPRHGFQSYAVWPHMTVFENVAYPLELRGLGRRGRCGRRWSARARPGAA